MPRDVPSAGTRPSTCTGGEATTTPRRLLVAIPLSLLLCLVLVGLTVAAEDGPGTLRGVITIVGQESLRDGEVVVSFAGTDDEAGNAAFDSDDPEYSLDLAPGDYTAYAWAPVFRASDRVPFTITSNGTTWVNLTVVRTEEVMGTVTDPDGKPIEGAVVDLHLKDGTKLGATVTDDEGRFRDSINPGTYDINLSKRGFEPTGQEFTIEPGQVLNLTIEMEPVPEDEVEEEFPVLALTILIFIVIAVVMSFGYTSTQARRLRAAKAEAEAKRAREMACPMCGGLVPEGEKVCPECGHVLQVRCSECGRSMDAGTEECPECGSPMD